MSEYVGKWRGAPPKAALGNLIARLRLERVQPQLRECVEPIAALRLTGPEIVEILEIATSIIFACRAW